MDDQECENCGSTDISIESDGKLMTFICQECDYDWEIPILDDD